MVLPTFSNNFRTENTTTRRGGGPPGVLDTLLSQLSGLTWALEVGVVQFGDLLAPERCRAVAAREECQRRVPPEPAPQPREAAVAHELVVGQADAPQLCHVLEQLPGQRRQVVVVHRAEGETLLAPHAPFRRKGVCYKSPGHVICNTNKRTQKHINRQRNIQMQTHIHTNRHRNTHIHTLIHIKTHRLSDINMEAVITTTKIHTQDES